MFKCSKPSLRGRICDAYPNHPVFPSYRHLLLLLPLLLRRRRQTGQPPLTLALALRRLGRRKGAACNLLSPLPAGVPAAARHWSYRLESPQLTKVVMMMKRRMERDREKQQKEQKRQRSRPQLCRQRHLWL